MPQTSNHNWEIPELGASEDVWGSILNDFFDDDLDTEISLKGPYADRPSPGSDIVKLYFATDRKIIYFNDGSSWEAVYGVGTESNPLPGTSYVESIEASESLQVIDDKDLDDGISEYPTGHSVCQMDVNSGDFGWAFTIKFGSGVAHQKIILDSIREDDFGVVRSDIVPTFRFWNINSGEWTWDSSDALDLPITQGNYVIREDMDSALLNWPAYEIPNGVVYGIAPTKTTTTFSGENENGESVAFQFIQDGIDGTVSFRYWEESGGAGSWTAEEDIVTQADVDTVQSNLDDHESDTTNPHNVDYSQTGAIEDAADTVSESNLDFDTATQAELDSHTGDTTNPHSVSTTQVNYDETKDLTTFPEVFEDGYTAFTDEKTIEGIDVSVPVMTVKTSEGGTVRALQYLQGFQRFSANGSSWSSWTDLATQTDLDNHTGNTSNPHNVDLEQARSQDNSITTQLADLGTNPGDFGALVDATIDGNSSQGTAHEFDINIGGVTLATFYIESDGSGGIQNPQVIFAQGIEAGPIEAPEDSLSTIIQQAVTDALVAGDVVGYSFSLDDDTVLSVKGEADGSGGTQNVEVALSEVLTLESTSEPTAPDTDEVTLYNDGSAVKAKFDDGSTATVVTK